MNYRKLFLISERDRKFDEYLDTLDKIAIWKAKTNTIADFHQRRSNIQLVEVLETALKEISSKLVYYDIAINYPEAINNTYYRILETN